MHYYNFNMGDHLVATAHLRPLEDLYYRRLIDTYCDREEPLPAEIAVLSRLVRARAPEELEAVQNVLAEFFTLDEAGWTNRFCDAQVEKYYESSASASRAANIRWTIYRARKAQAEREMLEAARAAAGPAPADEPADADAMRTHSERNAPKPTPNPNPNPTPNPNPNPDHTPTPSAPAPATASSGVSIPDPPAAVSDWVAFFAGEGFDQLAFTRNRGLQNDMENWVASRVSLGLMRDAMRLGLLRLGKKPTSPRYYAAMVDELRRPPDATGKLPPKPPRPPVEKI